MTTTANQVRVHAYGGPEVLQIDQVPLTPPGTGEILIRHTAIGVNFADTHGRNGRYPFPSPPIVWARKLPASLKKSETASIT